MTHRFHFFQCTKASFNMQGILQIQNLEYLLFRFSQISMGNSHPGSFLIGTTKNKRTMVILNAQLDWKVGQGHSVSTKFINLEDITLNISKNPSKNDGAMQQTRLIMEVFCNQGASLFVTWRGFSNFLERPMSSSSAGISNQNWKSYTPKGFF